MVLKGIASIPDTSSLSFSVLPFSFSISYSYYSTPKTASEARQEFRAQLQEQGREQPQTLNPDSGFVVPNFFDEDNMKQWIVLGSIFFMCIVRVVLSVMDVLKFQREQAARDRQWQAEQQARQEARLRLNPDDVWNQLPAGAAAPVQPDELA